MGSLYEFDWQYIISHQPADSATRESHGRLWLRNEHHPHLDELVDGVLQAVRNVAEMVKPASFDYGVRKTAFRSVRCDEFEVDVISWKHEELNESCLQSIVNNRRALPVIETRPIALGRQLDFSYGVSNMMQRESRDFFQRLFSNGQLPTAKRR